jgi:hypothetical protein
MKSIIYFILFIPLVAQSQTLTDSNLPIIVITASSGQVIADDPRIFCHMGVIDNGIGVRNYLTDPYNDYDGQISIEIRGSTSQQYPKKGYGLETQDSLGNNNNVSVLGLPTENDWILYGPYPDKTCIRNVLTFHLARRMGNYAPRPVYCELIINGEYKGLYLFMEKLKRDNDRVDINKLDSLDINGDEVTGGYIIKVDKTTGSIVDTWTSSYNPEVVFQYHDPAPNDLLLVQKTYIQSVVSEFEDAMWGANYNDQATGYHALINKLSFYDFFIMQELGRTVDGYRSSSFLYKDRTSVWGGLLNAGPMWDFNLSYGNADYCDADLTTGWQYNFDAVCPWFSSSVPFWWGKFMDDPPYTDGLKCRWEMLREGPLHIDSINYFIDSVSLYIEEGRIRNFQKWPIIGQYVNWNGFVGATYEQDLDYLKTYIENRIGWMDANLPGTCWPGLAEQEEILQEEVLSKVWPNPMTDFLFIGYTTKESGNVRITIQNLVGQVVKDFDLGYIQPGNYINQWFNVTVPSGVYLYSIYIDDKQIIQDKIIKN